MKQLFRHTSSLLRTALLLGAAAFVNIQQTQAQTQFPDAFLTVNPVDAIGDTENWYYIQFYNGNDRSYLAAELTRKISDVFQPVVRTKDYIPFATNIKWRLEVVPSGEQILDGNGNPIANQFYLKNYNNYYVYLDGSDFKWATDQKTPLTFNTRRDGGYEIRTANDASNAMYRESGYLWTNIDNYKINQNQNRLRIAKLKNNIAHIIYYQNPIYKSGQAMPVDRNTDTRGDAGGFTQHHYLTYSGTDTEVEAYKAWPGPSVITNGDLENDDVSCFFTASGVGATITPGVGKEGTRGVMITSIANKNNVWDTQFFVRANTTNAFPAGTRIHVEFDYKADKNATVSTQSHGEPGTFHGGMFADLDFTTNWQHFDSGVIIVTEGDYGMAREGDGFRTIAFNLGRTSGQEDVTFYFDNIVFSEDNRFRESDISSRSTILSTYNSWSLLTAACYHKDGLWTLEESSTPGNFYIKKYGTTSDYIKTTASGAGPLKYTLNSDNARTEFVLDDPNANRYTRIKNIANNKFMNYAGVLATGGTVYDYDADGWYVLEYDNQNNTWYAGFLPVEVPDPNQDVFYQVVLKAGTQMLGSDATWKAYSSFNPDTWTLEQFDDYEHFRLKNSAGQYYKSNGVLTDDETEAYVFTNEELNTLYTLEWLPKTETRINHSIIHKESSVRLYYAYNPTSPERQKVYGEQGLITDADSEWKNSDGTQKVNEFRITHYVKQGQPIEFGLPTTLGLNNDHRLYQRWYNYNNDTDLDGLKNHLKLKTTTDGEVMSYVYNNGIVTGEKLDWSTVFPGARTYEPRLFTYNQPDNNAFTLAVDVSRYSDFEYQNSSHLDGDLKEPSLTMRYIFYMYDAKQMATQLMACTGEKWLEEEKEIHFPATRLFYENSKRDAYKGEFIGIKHQFKDYWVFNGTGTTDNDLVSAVTNNTSGLIEVVVEEGGTGITKGGKEGKGYYLYDEGKNGGGKSYGDSRFVGFNYPDGGTVTATGSENPAYLKVYLNSGGTRYQIAKFKIIFDEGTSTLPWTSVNGSEKVKDTPRDPKQLEKTAGKPIAKITFDYPTGATFKNSSDYTIHNNGIMTGLWSEILNSSPLPLTFDNTNYGFDGDNPSWGSYAMVTTMPTRYGHQKTVLPANDNNKGYGIGPDKGMQSAFLYIDASEQPGDICSVDFMGEFCPNDLLMCSGWISGSNRVLNDDRCPGSVTITVKGERMEGGVKKKYDIYRFCPGQCYELNNGTTQVDGSGYYNNGTEWVYDGSATHVVWQQFYFTFKIDKKYDRHWIEVNNNCVSSTGGDFMLDNIEVYAMVPEVEPEMNTPVCLDKDGKTDMRLLKLTMGYDKLVKATNTNVASAENPNLPLGFVFLKKDVFLEKFQEGLKTYNGITISLADMEAAIDAGTYKDITKSASAGGYKEAYQYAFDKAMLGTKAIWDANNPTAGEGAGVLNFRWNNKFDKMEKYTFAKAVNNTKTIYGYTDPETNERILVMNGNYPKLKWETNTDYYIILSTSGITDINDLYSNFNICSDCNRSNVFQIEPPYRILSMESSDITQNLEVCEGKVPTLLTDLTGYNYNGEEVPLTNLNFDWWLGDPAAPVLATLTNYHSQTETIDGVDVKLDEALSALRAYYPDITTLDGIIDKTSGTPGLTVPMIKYLQTLVNSGQLILHQKSISVPASRAAYDDPYFYLVACPIHDGYFDKALNHGGKNDVVYFCDEPQGLRMKLVGKAPTLQCGFVEGENGYNDKYNYPEYNPVLSIRLANQAQFRTVQHGTTADAPVVHEDAPTTDHFLWLPIRDAKVQSTGSTKVVQKSDDYNIYLASTDDPDWDKEIYNQMTALDAENKPLLTLPIVGKIVQLNAIDVTDDSNSPLQKDNNRLCIYFTNNFDVREGYSYTLSLPFKESPGENTCDGTILVNLKIVPDYEVWTGAAGNYDWNNDQNWRRADGNTDADDQSLTNEVNTDELNRARGAVTNTSSPLNTYTTNKQNYRTAIDRVTRKGFAPLYCTHVLMKSDEWGPIPVLYDALDEDFTLKDAPFPNLRDTSTPILKFDMQAREYDIWSDTYGSNPDKGRSKDLIAEMYQINTCDEIAFQTGTELKNAHLLNYNSAWVEYELDTKRWYLLGSSLQGTIAGEWYAPTGSAQQKTTYYDPITFGKGYDRYSPAIFQRSWDKAKAVLYEVGSEYSINDDNDNPDDDNADFGTGQEGRWSQVQNPTNQSTSWQWLPTNGTADEYLDRLGYRPMSGKKANVAMKGIWSNTYNDATVDYANGGFSVMVMNHLKNNDTSGGKAIIRLPKEDTMYDYYRFNENGEDDGGTDTYLDKIPNEPSNNNTVQKGKNRALNRGRLKTDLLLPTQNGIQKTEGTESRYGDKRTITRVPMDQAKLIAMKKTFGWISGIGVNPDPVTAGFLNESVAAGVSDNLNYYLVENPFQCGLDMNTFFNVNDGLQRKYWLLTENGQHLVQQAKEVYGPGDEGYEDGYNPEIKGDWIVANGNSDRSAFRTNNAVVAPGQGFFVEAKTHSASVSIKFDKAMQVQSRYGEKSDADKITVIVGKKKKMQHYDTYQVDTDNDGVKETTLNDVWLPVLNDAGDYDLEDITQEMTVFSYKPSTAEGETFPLKARTRGEETEGAALPGLVITAKRGDTQSSALVMQHEKASNDFLPSEDTEVFITSDLENVPTVYTLCGRLATTINSIHDFRSLPVGVESNSEAPCTLTFKGVELLGDSISFYDALEQKLTPLTSGMTVSVSGQTQNRYYIVRSLIQEEAAAETHLQIFTEGLTAKVIASTAEPITSVRCYDTAGRLIHSATPQTSEYSFTLPTAGIYIINAETENDRKTVKLMAK